MILKTLFWASLFIVLYTYIGYGIVLFFLVRLKRLLGWSKKIEDLTTDFPEVTLLVAAYNEEDFIGEKIQNSLDLNYPPGKLKLMFVTDGSSDKTMEIIEKYKQIKHFHKPERLGKIAAVRRVWDKIDTPITIFTDANTLLNPEAVLKIVRHYADPKVGAVAGEKRISVREKDAANAAGEGIYWKYESLLKRWDSELYSVVGAAGELFSVRTDLHPEVPQDSIIEDFYTTMSIAKMGYKVRYEPEACAVEGPSASVGEELKRKIRIAAGGIQAILRLLPLLNIFKYGILSFQYVSHRVLRWTLTPALLPVMLFANIALAFTAGPFYKAFLAAQLVFLTLALVGFILEKKHMKVKVFFVPYYFFIMNYAVLLGAIRNLRGSQSVIWEKAKRSVSHRNAAL